MKSLLSVLQVKVGKKEADSANEILGKVLSTRQRSNPPGHGKDICSKHARST